MLHPMTNNTSTNYTNEIIALIQCDDTVKEFFSSINFNQRQIISFNNGLEIANRWQKEKLNIVAIFSQSEILSVAGISLLETFQKKKFPNVPFFLIIPPRHINDNNKNLALRAGIAEVFILPLNKESIEIRANFLIAHWKEISEKNSHKRFTRYKTPFIKRVFDVFFAGLALLMLSPIFLLIYILIRLESKGPVFYYSLRVGTGYRVFKFFKFRSMYVDADKRLKDLKHLNQYNNATKAVGESAAASTDEDVYLCETCRTAGTSCQFPIYADKNQWCEKAYMDVKKTKSGSAFFKIKDDPRITKIGKFIRNTSIDELPQLWNVIIGDMSIVGNRPLPLYEAEKLTTDKYSLRFLAPAGITGLWQVEKRGGKGEMSEEERLMLDNVYAQNHSFINDIKLILKTIPALFQKENV